MSEAVSPKRKAPVKLVALVVVGLLAGSVAWHVATDLMVPASSTGSVTAFTAMLSPRVSGQVIEVLVEDNQAVTAGDPLFVLDPAPFDLAVNQAQANLAQISQTVDASVLSLASSAAKVSQAQANLASAQASFDRAQTLFDRGLTAQSALDTSRAQLASAQGNFDAAEADLESAQLRAGTVDTNPQVQAAAIQLQQAELNRTFTTVVAPADGVVTNLKLAPGQFVNAGTAALTFIESDNTWMIVDLRENQLANIQVGDEADVQFDAVPGHIFKARVRGIAWGIDPGRTTANGLPQNQASSRWFEPARTIPVHLELVDDAAWPANVRVGSKVSALVFAEGRDSFVATASSAMQTVSSYFSFLY